MPAVLWESAQVVHRFLLRVGRNLLRLLYIVVGNLSWQPPLWLKRTGQAWHRLQRAYPRLVASTIILLFLFSCAGAWTWNWYQRQPKPRLVSVKIVPIEVTKLAKELKFPHLVIYFSEPAARLEDLKKPVQGARLEPHMNGGWRWINSEILVFEPTEDWPADQKFRIVFEKNLFPRHVLMERFVYETKTPPFAIAIKQLELYQDPTNPAQRQVTATLELTHAVDPGEIERHLQLTMIGGAAVFPASDPAPHFAINYGLHRRVAYLRSSTITLPKREDFMKVMLSKGVSTAQGGAATSGAVESKLRIPSLATMFQIDSINTTVVRNKNGEPEQLLVLNTSADISTIELAKALEIRLLPRRKIPEGEQTESAAEIEHDAEATSDSATEDESEAADSSDAPAESELKEEERWKSESDVPEEVVSHSRLVAFSPLPSQKPQDRQHVFRIRLDNEGELYVLVHKGVRALGDYPLTDDYDAVVEVPQLPREVQIEGNGGLLALNGERKLSIRSRGLRAVEYEIARVATAQINHLVSQTEGKFQHPHFQVHDLFNEENISRIALERQSIALENKWKANYSAFDFSEHLRKPDDGGSERGLFFLTARGWDPAKKKSIKAVKDSRFLLVTDIGILMKKNADGSHDIFLMSIKEGKPMANVSVDLLGKNGIPLQSGKSDENGRCSFLSVEQSIHEKTPVAFVARNGDDVSFIPYARDDRQLNFSRFDVDGAESVLPEELDAFVFTERGIYRPGDEMHIGLVVKQRNWHGQLKGLPLETEVLDARGHAVQTKKTNLPETAFTEFTYQTANESPTGVYTVNVYLMKNSRRSTLLGSTTASVKEFLPDRMKIETRLSQNAAHGWANPRDMHASIVLANLYGTPASDRRVTGRLELAPTAFRFPEFRDYIFFDPLADRRKARPEQSVDLGEKKTDTAGETQFDLQLERFADASYAVRFIAEGFEGEGGRSVTGTTNVLVSALPYVIGCKPDGDLTYIQMNKPRALDLVAVDPRLNRIAIENVTVNVIAQEYVSVLTTQENGNYAYQSVLKERLSKTEKVSISANGFRYTVPSTEPGNYIFELRDDQDRRLARLGFCVVGQGTVSSSLEKNAELAVKLDRTKCNSGDELAISITAPYSGSGLITIERDRVYAQAWFQANSANSVQHIRVPENFEGSGYINVAFVRAFDSKEIFASPLSYGVVPFTANMETRRLKIDLQTVKVAKPGEPLHIKYRADRACKIALFAVDEGILQVTDYFTPDPLEFYFRKCALGVQTSQIVDLIIPEFSLLRSVSAFGGGGDIQHLNPFKRVTDKPVVFWSGIIDADVNTREVVYDVPDFFDGTLKIMAVAVSNDSTGSAEQETLIRGPFIITPTVPVLAAPGDEFEAGVTVANNVEGSGADCVIQLRAETNDKLSVVRSAAQTLRVAEGHEQSTTFRFRANDKLGAGEAMFIVRYNEIEIKRRSTLSVRPPVPYMTEVRSGSFQRDSAEIPIARAMHSEFRKVDATLSALPFGLAHGLDAYLKDFPHGCSEQISSGAFCRLVLADEADFGLSRAEVNKQLEHTFGVLARRQNNQGAFGYWAPETGDAISFVTVYVMDFLSEAKAAGFAPPAQMFQSGLRNLQKMVARDPKSFSDAQTLAYAIYILTREGVITTNYILNLRDYLDKHHAKEWQDDATGFYLAGALHLLHKDADAEKLIGQYQIERKGARFCDDFHQALGTNSQYIAILAREFPARLKKITPEQFQQIVQAVADGRFNTLSAAYAVPALKAYSRAVAQNRPELSIAEVDANNHKERLVSGTKLLQRTRVSGEARAVQFHSDTRLPGPGLFFQVVEAGFDRQMPQEAVQNGLEVYRELLGPNSRAVTKTSLGEPIRVRLHVRSLRHEPVTNVAITDLLPGGFEIIDSSIHRGACSTGGVDYVDVREDRAVFFATVPVQALEIYYKIKSCNRGEFVVPPVFAESMYDRNIKGRGVGGRISVTQ
ncbi:MAG: alpha-2-macroglobulin [Verrucomicrobiota bacterium]